MIGVLWSFYHLIRRFPSIILFTYNIYTYSRYTCNNIWNRLDLGFMNSFELLSAKLHIKISHTYTHTPHTQTQTDTHILTLYAERDNGWYNRRIATIIEMMRSLHYWINEGINFGNHAAANKIFLYHHSFNLFWASHHITFQCMTRLIPFQSCNHANITAYFDSFNFYFPLTRSFAHQPVSISLSQWLSADALE